MQISFKDIVEVENGLAALGREILPVKMAWKVAKLRKLLRPALESRQEKMQAISKKYGTPDKEGSLRIRPADASWEEAQGFLKIINEQVVEVDDADTFKLSELNAEFEKDPPAEFANILVALGPLLIVDQEPTVEPSDSQRRQDKRRKARAKEK
jgi:hypothetical protein